MVDIVKFEKAVMKLESHGYIFRSPLQLTTWFNTFAKEDDLDCNESNGAGDAS